MSALWHEHTDVLQHIKLLERGLFRVLSAGKCPVSQNINLRMQMQAAPRFKKISEFGGNDDLQMNSVPP